MKLIPKHQAGDKMKFLQPTSATIPVKQPVLPVGREIGYPREWNAKRNVWTYFPSSSKDDAVRTSNWGMIAPRNAANKIYPTLSPELRSQYPNVGAFTNFLIANPNEITKYPGYRLKANYTPGASNSPFEYIGYSSGEVQMDANPSKKFNALVGKGRRTAPGTLTPTAK